MTRIRSQTGFTLIELFTVRKRQRAAFTLIELLVVISIIGLLIAILLPSLSKAREASASVQCQSNLRSINQANFMYAGDYRDFFPSAKVNDPAYTFNSRWPRNVYMPYLRVGAQSTVTNNPLVCKVYYDRKIASKNPLNETFTYTYNAHYSDDGPTQGVGWRRPDGLLRGPSKMGVMVDGVLTTDIPVSPFTAYIANIEATIRLTPGFIPGTGVMNQHAGYSNNWAYFDGHVKNISSPFPASYVPEAESIWYLSW